MTLLLPALQRRPNLWVCALLASVAGCSSGRAAQPRSDNGQTGSIGAAECQVDADCQREAAGIVAAQISEGHEAEVRSARCVKGGLCDTVLRRGDECFVDDVYGVPYDCSLSDAAIIAAEAARQENLATCGGQGCPEAPKPQYHPRDPLEWDGMPVDLIGPYCEESAFCGLALACVQQMCGACTADEDCAPGEGCVVEHCLKTELIGCRSYRDCGAELCLLSGFTGGTPRGNEDMRSYCSNKGGAGASDGKKSPSQ